MRILVCVVTVALFFMSCGATNYKVEELYGKWVSETMSFNFMEDGSCDMYIKTEQWPGEVKWRAAMGNTLEITADGKVIMANLTIKSLKGDELTIETRQMVGARRDIATSHVMKRVKE